MSERRITVIEGSKPYLHRAFDGMTELIAHRELLFLMTANRLEMRYQQSWLGWAWAIANPLFFLAFLSVAGSAMGAHRTTDVAYPIFILAGIAPWAFISTSLSTSAAGLLNSRSLISKVHFPRELIPLSFVLAALADLIVAIALTVVGTIVFDKGVSVTAFAVIPLSALLLMYAASLSLLLSISQICIRDIAIGLPLILQGLLLTTPILYPTDSIPAEWRTVYLLNPLALLIEAFRQALIGQRVIEPLQFLYISMWGLILLMSAYVVFKAVEPKMVDEL